MMKGHLQQKQNGFQNIAVPILEGFEMKGGVERDGIKLAIKDEKAIEAEAKIRKWLQKIKIIKQ